MPTAELWTSTVILENRFNIKYSFSLTLFLDIFNVYVIIYQQQADVA